MTMLSARIASEGSKFPEEYQAAVLTKQYRIVPNTFDASGGVFVMFGDALAPGEKAPVSQGTSASPAPRKKWWQFWIGSRKQSEIFMQWPEGGRLHHGYMLCYDDHCPNPNNHIREGEGYLFIHPEMVKFRRDCITESALQAKLQRMQQGRGVAMLMLDFQLQWPSLFCHECATKAGIDLEVASNDAKHWWKTWLVPLRPTPKRGDLLCGENPPTPRSQEAAQPTTTCPACHATIPADSCECPNCGKGIF